jgi:transglutaminase-like putative cysteine protease
MKKYVIILVFICLSFKSFAQLYPFESISPELRKRADAVIRSHQCLYTIKGYGNAVEKRKVVVTIINEKAIGFGIVGVNYDNFSRVKYLRGAVYDERGDLIKEIGFSDIYDGSAISGGSFYTDDRVKRFTIPKTKYPFTLEYEYEKEYSSILNYPEWNFQPSYGLSVEKSGIQIVVPEDIAFKYYSRNLKNEVDSIIMDDKRIYTWQEENLPAVIKNTSYLLNPVHRVPILYTAPTEFEFGGYKGSMNSWKTFGEWNYNLIKDQDKLPAAELLKVSEMVKGIQDTRQKVRLLYEYMQSKTRYVSIQIGIGGWQPVDPASVSINGSGDCKGLSNYMKALLKAAGINSFYTVINAGTENRYDTNVNFVSNSFNHVILCVPLQSDTVWLECTSQTNPFNYLGDFTDDRPALLITPQGGKMVRTPSFSKEDNLFKRTGEISIYDSGSSLIKISNSYSGYNYGNASMLFRTKSEDEMKKFLYSSLRFYDFRVNSVSYREEKSEKPHSLFAYSISVNDLTVKMDKRLYFNPTIKKDGYINDSPVDILIPQSEKMIDSISYYLPAGYRVEYLPGNVDIETEFGKFS